MSLSAPGMADFSIIDKFLFVFFSFDVYPSNRAALSLPIYMIWLVNSIVLSSPDDYCAKRLILRLLSEDLLLPA